MTTMSPQMRKALEAAAEHEAREPGVFSPPWRFGRTNTVEALAARGLLEERLAGRLTFEYRLTDAGRDELAR